MARIEIIGRNSTGGRALDLASGDRFCVDQQPGRPDVRAAQAALREANAAFSPQLQFQGLAIATQLIDAESALIAARIRRAEAEADRRIAVAAYRKALGMLQTDHLKSSL